MPLPKPLAELKKDLEEQIGSDLAAAVKTTQGFLSDNQDKRSQTILLEGRLSQIVRDMGTGIIKTEDYQLEVARIRKALLDLVGGLDESDFTPG
ncbi:MAG: hypothetical protein KDC61_16345, partial [Saprospiraceae bacterium]|nr:hypothetical protein [Saprospiraceae bacterium]